MFTVRVRRGMNGQPLSHIHVEIVFNDIRFGRVEDFTNGAGEAHFNVNADSYARIFINNTRLWDGRLEKAPIFHL